MKAISREALRKYYLEVLGRPAVTEVIQKAHSSNRDKPKLMEDYIPACQFDDKITGFNAKVAGFAVGTSGIHIANWILKDESEAKAVVRHEVAHLVQHYEHGQCRPHGKEFTKALKIVSPNTWRKDRHWHDNPEIAKARKESERNNKIHLT
tara:strand:+ start:632 stop:1084 length:453 start_codon:yes stop_codon:yes gene_type:complete